MFIISYFSECGVRIAQSVEILSQQTNQQNSKVHSDRTPTPVQHHTQTVAQATECCSMFTDSVKVPRLPWDEQALEESRASG